MPPSDGYAGSTAVVIIVWKAIVVPETIDAIRALTALEEDAATSIEKTDTALGVVRAFIPVSYPVIA